MVSMFLPIRLITALGNYRYGKSEGDSAGINISLLLMTMMSVSSYPVEESEAADQEYFCLTDVDQTAHLQPPPPNTYMLTKTLHAPLKLETGTCSRCHNFCLMMMRMLVVTMMNMMMTMNKCDGLMTVLTFCYNNG